MPWSQRGRRVRSPRVGKPTSDAAFPVRPASPNDPQADMFSGESGCSLSMTASPQRNAAVREGKIADAAGSGASKGQCC